MVLYPEQVILDYEICQNAYDLLHGLEFDEADMALDVIRDVGPGGHFLAQKHTRKRIRDFRLSRLLRQKGASGSLRDPRQVALEEFKRIDEAHRPQPLPKEVLVELGCILAAAEREVARMG
jgi:trimethylamine--corrinoid protein Co-methyltransferase